MKLKKGLRASHSLHQRIDFPQTSTWHFFAQMSSSPNTLYKPTIITPSAKSWHSFSPFPASFFSTGLITINMSTLLCLLSVFPPRECFSMNKEIVGLLYSLLPPHLLDCEKHSRCSIDTGWMNENRVPEIDLNMEAVKWKALQVGVDTYLRGNSL